MAQGDTSTDIIRDFQTGNFDYLPGVAPGIYYDYPGDFYKFLEDNWAVVQGHPSDECITGMPDKAIEDLAANNLRQLRRYWPKEVELFAAVQVRPETKLFVKGAGLVAVKEAVVVPSTQITGRIAGPNRRMLDILYDELGVKGDPAVTTTKVKQRVFGLGGGSPAQTQTHGRRRLSFRGSMKVSGDWRRAKFDEIEVVYGSGESAGRVDSAVRLEKR